MADERSILIETPGEEELLHIASQVANGQFGTEPDEGDLPDWNPLDGDDDPGASTPRSNGKKSPVRGAVAYVGFGVPMDCYLAFTAWDEQKAKALKDTPDEAAWEATREADKMVDWLREMVGRDLEADEGRHPDERHYWFGGLFQGLTYKKLVVDTHMRGFETQLKQQLRLVRQQQMDRIRQRLGGEWTDEAIEDLLGPLPDDE